MLNTAGVFILVLIYEGYTGRGGLAMHEFPSHAACQAAIVQLETVKSLTGYCIAEDVTDD